MLSFRLAILPAIALTWIAPAVSADAGRDGQSGYHAAERSIEGFDFSQRAGPRNPEAGRTLRVVIDSDAANEIDDQWAIALAILSPERFFIQGFVAANFDNEHGSPGSTTQSYDEIRGVLFKAGMEGSYPVFKGSDPMWYKYEPLGSEGVDFIIRTAMSPPKEDPLWIVELGATTDLASAYLKAHQIHEQVVFF